MRSLRHPALWLASLVLLACQQPPDISGEIDEHASLLSDANELACSCHEDLGYATISECEDVLDPVGINERQCIASVLEGHEDDAKDYLACANVALGTYVACLEANVSCGEGVYDGCTDDYEQTVAACPQLPEDVRPSFVACTD